MLRSMLTALWFSFASVASAGAATTVYADGVYSSTGLPTVVNPAAAFGAADGISAIVTRPGVLVLSYSSPLSGAGVIVNGLRLTATSVVQVSVGAIVGGVAVFTPVQTFPNNFATSASFDFSAGCALISTIGCSLLRVRLTGPVGAGFLLDGVSGVSAAPEPQTWALMILGFIGAAMRLKAERHEQRVEDLHKISAFAKARWQLP